jgi:hypothetical protein
VIWMDSKANFISNLILSSMIIGRIRKEMKMSSLRSKTLLWVGVLWPYDLGVGPWVGGGGTQCGAGSNTSLAGSRGRQSDGARCDRSSLTYQSGYTGVNRCCRVKPPGLGSRVEALALVGSNGPRLEQEGARPTRLKQGFGSKLIGRIKPFLIFKIFPQFANSFGFNSNLDFKWFLLTK